MNTDKMMKVRRRTHALARELSAEQDVPMVDIVDAAVWWMRTRLSPAQVAVTIRRAKSDLILSEGPDDPDSH